MRFKYYHLNCLHFNPTVGTSKKKKKCKLRVDKPLALPTIKRHVRSTTTRNRKLLPCRFVCISEDDSGLVVEF